MRGRLKSSRRDSPRWDLNRAMRKDLGVEESSRDHGRK